MSLPCPGRVIVVPTASFRCRPVSQRGGLGQTGTGGAYCGDIKYRTTTNVVRRRLVAMSLLATWHLESVSEMSEKRWDKRRKGVLTVVS